MHYVLYTAPMPLHPLEISITFPCTRSLYVSRVEVLEKKILDYLSPRWIEHVFGKSSRTSGSRIARTRERDGHRNLIPGEVESRPRAPSRFSPRRVTTSSSECSCLHACTPPIVGSRYARTKHASRTLHSAVRPRIASGTHGEY